MEQVPSENGEARLVHLRHDNDVAEALAIGSPTGTGNSAARCFIGGRRPCGRLTFGESGPEPFLIVVKAPDRRHAPRLAGAA